MKKYWSPQSFYKISILVLFVTVVLIVNSCRKEVKTSPQLGVNQPAGTIDVDIPALKTIFGNAIKGQNSHTTLSTTHSFINFIQSLNVIWDTYTIQKRADSSTVAEFEVKNDSGLFVLKKLFIGDSIKYRNRTTVTFIKYKDGSRLNFFTQIIEDLTPSANSSVISQIHYDRIVSGFSGIILYYSLDRQFINGYHFTKDKLDGDISFPESTVQTQTINSVKTNSMAAPCTTFDVYVTYCEWGGTTANPYQYFHGCSDKYVGSYTVCDDNDPTPVGAVGGDPAGNGTPPNPCTPAPPQNVQSVVNGKKIIDFIPPPTGGGSGGSTGTTPCPTTPAVTPAAAFDNKIDDNLAHDCLVKILNAIKAVKSGNFASIISALSGIIPNYNWDVSEGSLPVNTYGVSTYSKTTGTVYTIFDYNKLKNSTDLATATTMIHEAVHSYLSSYFFNDPINFNKTYAEQMDAFLHSKTLDDAQHLLMAKAFISDISAAIKTVAKNLGYTNITDQMFNDMAWAGLQGTNAYKSLDDDDQIRIQNRISSEQNNKSYGTEYPKGKALSCK